MNDSASFRGKKVFHNFAGSSTVKLDAVKGAIILLQLKRQLCSVTATA